MLVSVPGLPTPPATGRAPSRQARLQPELTERLDRWHQALAVLGVLLLHLLLFVWLMQGSRPSRMTEAEADLIVVLDTSLAPSVAAKSAPPMPQAPARPQAAAKPLPAPAPAPPPEITPPPIEQPKSSLPEPAPKPEDVQLPAPEPTPAPQMPANRPAAETIAPISDFTSPPSESPADRDNSPDTATARTTTNPSASAIEQRWQAELLRHLDRHLRYPQQARNLRHQGTVLVRFRIDHDGHLHAIALERGSAHDSLNKEALAVLQRAQPLPAPPPELAQADSDVVLPITFRLRRR